MTVVGVRRMAPGTTGSYLSRIVGYCRRAAAAAGNVIECSSRNSTSDCYRMAAVGPDSR